MLSKSTLARRDSRAPGRKACSLSVSAAALPQGQGRRARAIDDAHNQRHASAIVEVLFDRIAEKAGLPQAAEYLLKFQEALDENRTIDGAAQRAADEGGAGRGQTRYGMIGAAFFGDL